MNFIVIGKRSIPASSNEGIFNLAEPIAVRAKPQIVQSNQAPARVPVIAIDDAVCAPGQFYNQPTLKLLAG